MFRCEEILVRATCEGGDFYTISRPVFRSEEILDRAAHGGRSKSINYTMSKPMFRCEEILDVYRWHWVFLSID